MTGYMTVEELRQAVDDDTIDTVIVAMPDMAGRLQGKRLDARHFLEDILGSGLHTCSYLIARNVEMEILDGFEVAGWATGLGDFVLSPDVSTLRRVPWMPGTALVLADTVWEDGRSVVQSPRDILRRQIERLEERGWRALVATELEFLLFDDSYAEAHSKNYQDLRPASYFDVDYSILGTARAEPLMRTIRRNMRDAGMPVEGVTGECNLGQFELGFKYADALKTCDNHVLYKEGVKEIAMQNDVSVTFMSKFNQGAGNSCHVHLSLVDEQGQPVFAGEGPSGFSKTFEHFLAGQVAVTKELSLFVAPNINSYKRYQEGTFAPTALQWGRDNRTCAVRVIGDGRSLRLENRTPGGDVNPYLAVAAVIAAGLHGVEHTLELPPAAAGNVYEESSGERMPRSLREAAGLWSDSGIAEKAFGGEVVRHYTNAALQEVSAFDSAVTDWERVRGFERM